jgi:hypothetical protein
MRRPDRKVLLALALFAGAAWAGFTAVGRLGPEQAREAAERSLERALGGRVHLASARVSFGNGIAFEGHDLEAWPQPGGPALHVERAAARIEPLSLLLGRVQLRRLVLEQATLRIVRGPDGRIAPPAPFAALLGDAPAPRRAPGAWGVVERVGDAARALLQAPLPLLRASLAPREVELRNARLELVDERAEAHLALEEVQAFLVRHARGGRLELGGSGRLTDAAHETGWLTLEGRTRGKSGELGLRARHVELAALAPWLRELHPDLTLTGVARGAIQVEFGEREGRRVRIELLAGDLDARVPRRRGVAPFAISGDAALAAAELALAPDQVRLLEGELELDGQRLELSGNVARPLGPEAPARLAVGLRNLDLARVRQLARVLPDELEQRIASALERVEAGHLAQLEVSGSGPLADWRDALEAPADAPRLPIALEGTARFREAALRLGSGERLAGLSGELRLARDRLELRGLRRAPDAPELDVTLMGLDRLLQHGERAARGAPALPGLAPLAEYLRGGPPAPEEKRGALGAVELELAWLSHPLAVWPLQDVRVSLGAPANGVRRIEAAGAWGGLGVRGSGSLTAGAPDAPGRLALRVEVGGRAARPAAPAEWALGSWRALDARWRGAALPEVRGRFRGEGSALRLLDTELRLAQGRPLRGALRLDLSQRDQVPLELEAVADDAALGELGPLLGLGPGELSGRLDAAAHLAGPLRPGSSARATLAGRMSFSAEKGELRRRPAVAEAIAASDDVFKEFRDKKPFKFESVQAELTLDDGRLATEALLVQGTRARLVVSGGIRVDAPPHEVEAVVAVFPRNAMNSIVGNVPVIGPILRGSDGSVVGAYLEVTGPAASPYARRLRNRSLAAGVLTGVPNFVVNGLRAIGSVLARLGPDAAAPPPEEGS